MVATTTTRFSPALCLINHPDKEPNQEAGIIHGDPAGGVYFQFAGLLGCAEEHKHTGK